MKMMMYSIYDTVAEVFNKPFMDHNDASACRAFDAAFVSGEKGNKDDYVLYRVGEFNDGSGELTPCLPSKVRTGFDIKAVENV